MRPSLLFRLSTSSPSYLPLTYPQLPHPIQNLRANLYGRIQETLLHALNASPQNWPTLIQNHALSLLRSGDCTTFPALMSRVLSDIKSDTELSRASSASSMIPNGSKTGKHAKAEEVRNGKGENGQSLALPKNVVEEGVKITRECLELVCEVVE